MRVCPRFSVHGHHAGHEGLKTLLEVRAVFGLGRHHEENGAAAQRRQRRRSALRLAHPESLSQLNKATIMVHKGTCQMIPISLLAVLFVLIFLVEKLVASFCCHQIFHKSEIMFICIFLFWYSVNVSFPGKDFIFVISGESEGSSG